MQNSLYVIWFWPFTFSTGRELFNTLYNWKETVKFLQILLHEKQSNVNPRRRSLKELSLSNEPIQRDGQRKLNPRIWTMYLLLICFSIYTSKLSLIGKSYDINRLSLSLSLSHTYTVSISPLSSVHHFDTLRYFCLHFHVCLIQSVAAVILCLHVRFLSVAGRHMTVSLSVSNDTRHRFPVYNMSS